MDALGSAKMNALERSSRRWRPSPVPYRRRCSASLAEGKLYVRKSDQKVFIVAEEAGGFALTDPVTGASAG